MGIRDRWISLLHRAATGTKKTRTLLTPIGVVIFGVFTGMFVTLAVLVDRWLSFLWPLSNGLSWLIAAPLIAIGVGVTAWSAFHFLKVKGTPVPFNPPPTLVMTGPYQFVRNPHANGGFSHPFWNWLRHQVTLTCRLFYSTVYLGKRMGAQRDRGA